MERSPAKKMVLARKSLTETVTSLKRSRGKDLIAFRGTGFASSLIEAKAVDEFQFFVNPMVLGEGDSIFGSQTTGLSLELIQSTAYPCGIVVQRYAPAWDHARRNISDGSARR